MDKEELQNNLEKEIREFISSVATQIEEMTYKEAGKQLERDIDREKFSRKMPVIRKNLKVPEGIKELEKLKSNLQEADKIIHDNPAAIGDEHEFIDNPYSKEPSEEALKQFSEALEDIDREKVLSCDKGEIGKSREILDSFKKRRQEN